MIFGADFVCQLNVQYRGNSQVYFYGGVYNVNKDDCKPYMSVVWRTCC